MKLKLHIFALMAMLLCAFSANAQVTTEADLRSALATGGDVTLGGDITVGTSITAIDGTVLDLNEKTLYINVENSFYDNVTIKNGNIVLGKDDVHVCDGYFEVNAGKTLVLDGVNMSSSAEGIKGYAVFHLKTGANLDLLNSTLNIADNEYAAGYIVYAGEATATVDIVNTTITGSKVNGIVHATTVIDESTVTLTDVIEHGINRSGVTIDDSNVAISGGTGRGITAQHGDLVITGNSTVEISDMGEATIELRNDKSLSVAETANVTLDVAVNNTTGGTISGTVNVPGSAVAKIGETGYATLAEAVAAAESGATITLMNGEHELPAFSNKELTFVGESKDGVIVNDAPNANTQGWAGSTFHFENLTAKGINENYYGLANGVVAVTYKDCILNNQRFLYAETVTFEDCVFNQTSPDWYNVWTYSAENVSFTRCTFNCAGKSVLVYHDTPPAGTDGISTNLTVTECAFVATQTVSGKAAIEVDTSTMAGANITVDGATTVNDTFGGGSVSGNKLWNNKKGSEGVNNDITIVVNNVTVLKPVTAVAKVGDVEYTSLQAALDAAAAGTGNVTVTILSDVDLTDVDWNPVTVSAPGYPVVTVEGNNKTITGLNDMLFAGTWAGGSGLIIKDLTIANSAIVNDKDDAAGTVGVGAFIGYPQASATITLENCHLKNSSVEGGHWTGGLIGMAGGYNGNDGPVFMNLTIKGCSVTGSTITGKGSAGGVIGHGSCAAWTNVVIENTTVSGNTITSTGSSNNKAGAVMGTIGAAGQPTTANGETKTGGASVSATVADNTVTSNGTAITTIYGRQGTATGQLYVAGGSYDNYPIEQGVAYAAPIEGYVIVENADGTYGLDEKVELPEVVITDIKSSLKDSDPDLTFALNFTIKDLENLDEEYLNKVMEQYGSWYTDYVLTISGLTEESVTFNANGDGDGYLAGQYDAWSENWVSVPFEDVTLANGESIYIMEYAAKLMGQSGLRYTLAEIATIVQNFDCGVYFSPEFLTANPGLQVDLHLKVFTEDAEGNKVNDINVATNEFDVEDYVAIVHANGKQTTYCTTLAEAVAAAEADETITLIADVELTETLNIPAGKTIALDLNGKTVSMTDASAATVAMIKNNGTLTINDSSAEKNGKLTFATTTPSTTNSYASNTISNYGTITIEAGTIENASETGGACYALDNYAGSTATINGGKFTATKTTVRIFNWTNGDANKATLNVNGGEIYSKDGYAINVNSGNAPAVALNITGGTITTYDTDYNLAVYVINKNDAENFTANVTGGTFNGYFALNGVTSTTMAEEAVSISGGTFNKGVICYEEPAYGFITGGTFTEDVNDYCADGFVCEANGDGTYGIVADPSYIAEFTIDDAEGIEYTNDAVKTVGKLTYKRTFVADIWNALYLPFDIELTEELLAQFDFYEYNQMLSKDTDGDRVPDDFAMELFVFQGGTLEANYPYFVRPKDASACTLTLEIENATLYAAEENSFVTTSMKNTFTLSGTHKPMTAEELAGKFVMSTEGKWQTAGSGMKPHRLSLSITDRNGNSVASKAIRMVVRGEDGYEGTTGVEEVEIDSNNNVIYDLSGRRVAEPVKGGIYIVNGKKVIF